MTKEQGYYHQKEVSEIALKLLPGVYQAVFDTSPDPIESIAIGNAFALAVEYVNYRDRYLNQDQTT